jgi:peptidoglycan/LPS O-acetylase OafA/YrhL
MAILLVMLAHGRDISHALPAALSGPYEFVHLVGWVGVDLFFVLSGFLVSGLLFDEHISTGAINLKRFYVRRAFKIIPAFYFLTLVTVIYDAIVSHRVVVVHLIHDVLFLQSYRSGAWAHAWTLAIEVHFYILLGLLLWYLARHPPKSGSWLARLPAILGGVLVAVFLARLINSGVRTENFNVHRQFQPTHLHLDVLAAGVLLRYFYTYHFDRLAFLTRGGAFAQAAWIALGIVLVLPSAALWSPHSFLLTAFIPTLNYLGFGLILFQATQIPFPAAGLGAWVVKPFDYFGKHSYSIYLWHLPVYQWIIDRLFPGPAGSVPYLGCAIVASLLVGSFFSEVLEIPVLHLRNRLFPSRSTLHVPAESHTATVAG